MDDEILMDNSLHLSCSTRFLKKKQLSGLWHQNICNTSSICSRNKYNNADVLFMVFNFISRLWWGAKGRRGNPNDRPAEDFQKWARAGRAKKCGTNARAKDKKDRAANGSIARFRAF